MENNTAGQDTAFRELANWGFPRVNALIGAYNEVTDARQWDTFESARDDMENEIRSQLRAIGRYIAEIAKPMSEQGGDHEYDGVMSYVWDGLHEHLGYVHGTCFLRSEPRGSNNCALDGPVSTARVTKDGYIRKNISSPKRLRVYKKDGYKCVSCGTSEDLSVDHIHPVSRGGSNDMANLQTMCMPCNMSKGAKIVGSNE